MRYTINFPFVVEANDYHEFGDFADRLGKLIGKKVKYTEVNTDWGYNAVFYIGKQDKAYKKLLKQLEDKYRSEE